MNKITYFVIILILTLSSASALEKKDCTGLKKLSKAFIACKSGNLKAGIINTGSSIKEGTVGKIKKVKIKKVKVKKDKKPKIKSSGDRKLTGLTKQYPKGIKK
jgi:hypothetical protein